MLSLEDLWYSVLLWPNNTINENFRVMTWKDCFEIKKIIFFKQWRNIDKMYWIGYKCTANGNKEINFVKYWSFFWLWLLYFQKGGEHMGAYCCQINVVFSLWSGTKSTKTQKVYKLLCSMPSCTRQVEILWQPCNQVKERKLW